MMLRIPGLLTGQQVTAIRAVIDAAEWTDGNVTSGRQAAQAKRNAQLPEQSAAARQAGDAVLQALERNALFVSGALPLRVFPPLFNRYETGQHFGTHIDNAIRQARMGMIRTDLSATLFLTDPADYDGGELIVEDSYGAHSVKLDAGDMILYPGTSRHHVTPVTRGARVSSFFWIQSLVRDDSRRAILFDLDTAIQAVRANGETPEAVRLTGVYHNLLRQWAET